MYIVPADLSNITDVDCISVVQGRVVADVSWLTEGFKLAVFLVWVVSGLWAEDVCVNSGKTGGWLDGDVLQTAVFVDRKDWSVLAVVIPPFWDQQKCWFCWSCFTLGVKTVTCWCLCCGFGRNSFLSCWCPLTCFTAGTNCFKVVCWVFWNKTQVSSLNAFFTVILIGEYCVALFLVSVFIDLVELIIPVVSSDVKVADGVNVIQGIFVTEVSLLFDGCKVEVSLVSVVSGLGAEAILDAFSKVLCWKPFCLWTEETELWWLSSHYF